MIEVIWATPLYEFLRQCNASSLTKSVLDCGAGGDHPPLSLFHQYGYRTYGIEIAEQALSKAKKFCKENRVPLNIFRSIDDPDDRTYCETAPAKLLLRSERFAKHEDNEADSYFKHSDIIRKEKRLIDKVHGSGRSIQAYIEFIARKR